MGGQNGTQSDRCQLPLTPAELISSLIGIAGLALVAYGIHMMGRGNTERQAIADTLNTHTQALQKVLEKMD